MSSENGFKLSLNLEMMNIIWLDPITLWILILLEIGYLLHYIKSLCDLTITNYNYKISFLSFGVIYGHLWVPVKVNLDLFEYKIHKI